MDAGSLIIGATIALVCVFSGYIMGMMAASRRSELERERPRDARMPPPFGGADEPRDPGR